MPDARRVCAGVTDGQPKIGGTAMMITTLIGAATLALGHGNAKGYGNHISSPGIISINTAMVEPDGVNRRQDRFSDRTRGEVVGVVNADGSVEWQGPSDRERLGGQ